MNDQLSLFETPEESLANRICEDLNKLPTVWKGQFYVGDVNLQKWENQKNKVLNIYIRAKNNKVGGDNTFVQLKGDRDSQKILCNCGYYIEWLAKLSEDRDFSMNVTPWSIFVFYHNFEGKKLGKW